MMKVQVLMSSYNGAKYIKEQIESVLNQKGVDVSLLIRDDGSKDSTPELLRELEASDNIKCIYEKNIGVKRSFLKLVSMSDEGYDYYALSDQDDIWMDNKLKEAVDYLKKEDNTIPLIYGSSVSLYFDGKVIGNQYVNPNLTLGNFLIKNYYPGCTMVFNSTLRDLLNGVDYMELQPNPLHDHWMNLVCTFCGGKVLMNKIPHMLYRQHGNNVIGDRNFAQKVRGNGLIGHSDNTRLKICRELNRFYGEKADVQSIALIERVLNYQNSVENTLRLAFDKKIKPISLVEKIAMILLVLSRKF